MPETVRAKMMQAALKQPAVTLDEIRHLVQNDLPALPVYPERLALGAFAAIYAWLAKSQQKETPGILHPRIALFTLSNMNVDAVKPLAIDANADLQVYDVGGASEEQAAETMAYGMMAVQPGIDFLHLASLEDASPQKNDVFAMTGAIIAARLARVPVLLDGKKALAAMTFLEDIKKGSADHCKDAKDIFQANTTLAPGCAGALFLPFLKSLTRI